MKIVTPFNGKHVIRREPATKLPSMTKPDQTLSIKQILKRHAGSSSALGIGVPQYDEDDTMPDARLLDFAEMQDMSEELEAVKARLNVKAKEIRDKQAQDKLDKLVEEKIAAKAKEAAKEPPPAQV